MIPLPSKGQTDGTGKTCSNEAEKGQNAMKGYLMLAAVIALGPCLVPAVAEEVKLTEQGAASKSEEKINSLVTQLGSKRFQEREKATRELSLLGASVLPKLKEAAFSPDAEVRRRAQQLVNQLEPVPPSPIIPPSQEIFILKSLC